MLMKNDAIFREQQKFRQTWLWLLLVVSGIPTMTIAGSGLYVQLVLHRPFGNNPMNDTGLIVVSACMFLVMGGIFALFLFARLDTAIDREGIRMRFPPLVLTEKLFRWGDIESCEVVRYSPIGDYGGWGIRSGRQGKAYNVSGDRGLRIHLKTGKSILIGTQKAEELSAWLQSFRDKENSKREYGS